MRCLSFYSQNDCVCLSIEGGKDTCKSVETVQYSFSAVQSSSTLAGTPFSVLKHLKPTNASVVNVKRKMKVKSVMNTMSKKAQKLRQSSMEFVKLRTVKARETRNLGKELRPFKIRST